MSNVSKSQNDVIALLLNECVRDMVPVINFSTERNDAAFIMNLLRAGVRAVQLIVYHDQGSQDPSPITNIMNIMLALRQDDDERPTVNTKAVWDYKDLFVATFSFDD